jgi:chitodextrinase
VSGLNASTAYEFYVKAKDAAGNLSIASNTANIITTAPADTTAPTVSSLSASGTTTSGTNLSWTAANDNVGVIDYNVYQNGILKTTVTTTSLAVSELNASTAYEFYVKAKDAAGNLSVASNTAIINTMANTTVNYESYCSSYGNSAARGYIKEVQIGTINNVSGNNNGYGDFTSMSTNLTTGASNAIVIIPDWIGRSSEIEYYNVWIDFNQDGDFDDNGELVFSKSKTKAKKIKASLTIPTTALTGITRMRVSMNNNMLPNPCEIFSYGEVEDYTLSITSGATTKTTLNKIENKLEVDKLDFKLYPNPVKESLLYISDIDSNPTYRIFNMMRTVVAKGFLETKSINVSQLASGIYILELNDGIVSTTKRFIKQ